MNKRALRDSFGKTMAWVASSITIAACLGIIIYLFINGIQRISPSFIFQEPLMSIDEANSGGILTPLIGTLILTLLGIAIALPWALATAIWLSEYSNRSKMAGLFRLGIDVLAGIPTIVIAIFGVSLFRNQLFGFLSTHTTVNGISLVYGRSFLVAGFTMAIMVLPFVIKTCEEALKAVPQSYREGSLAMGASKWHTIIKIVVPSSRNGIVTAIVLGMGRIIGDTAIVWIALGGSLRMTGVQPWWTHPISTLQNTGSTLTSYIFYTSPAGEGYMPGNAFGASLVLIVLIILLNFFADFFVNFRQNVKEER